MSKEGFYPSEEEAEEYLAGVHRDFDIDPEDPIKFNYGFAGDERHMQIAVAMLAEHSFDFRPRSIVEDKDAPPGEPRFWYTVQRLARFTPAGLLADLAKYQRLANQAGVQFFGITASSRQ